MTPSVSIPFEGWEPTYEAILTDLGFDRSVDEAARDEAAAHLAPFAPDRLDLRGSTVAVAVGADLDGPGLRRLREVDDVVATADALERLENAAVPVRLAVTDLDSDPPRVCRRARSGLAVAVHAHGDNRAALRRWLPRMPPVSVLGTTQARPGGPMVNVGGFTDGDRAAYLAHAFGAESLAFVGWNLADADVDASKRRKLGWAARLLADLEGRRGERFAVLDPVRDRLEG